MPMLTNVMCAICAQAHFKHRIWLVNVAFQFGNKKVWVANCPGVGLPLFFCAGIAGYMSGFTCRCRAWPLLFNSICVVNILLSCCKKHELRPANPEMGRRAGCVGLSLLGMVALT